jgi:hypothetical protein
MATQEDRDSAAFFELGRLIQDQALALRCLEECVPVGFVTLTAERIGSGLIVPSTAAPGTERSTSAVQRFRLLTGGFADVPQIGLPFPGCLTPVAD